MNFTNNFSQIVLKIKKIEWPQTAVVFIVAFVITTFANYTFFSKIAANYPDQFSFRIAIFILLLFLLFLLLRVLSFIPYFKFALVPILLFSSLQAYVSDNFGVIGDEVMIRNVLMTDFGEINDVINAKILIYFFLLGIVPSVLLLAIKLKKNGFKRESWMRVRDIIASLLIIIIALFLFNKTFASFFREQKSLRYYANPVYFFYSTSKIIAESDPDLTKVLASLGKDAKIPETDTERELIIFVLGETARSDRFSLNGYNKETNPRLKNENVISYKDVYSCGTSTATSVPCMFSIFGRNAFDHKQAADTENLVDVLEHTGRISVLWRDNNSDSKGVAVRVPFEDFKSPKTNPVCDIECRDVGMLEGLQGYIDKIPSGDIFIVLHQMGNHGPAYFKRYPPEFEKFKPACKNYDLGHCTNDEINNAYDNAILYTDFFLAKIIELLKQNEKFETGMFYISDHGESLGENGIYLHGLPYSIAPIEQKKVPLIMWFGSAISDDLNIEAVRAKADHRFTHDNVFHTILRLMEVNTGIYDKSKDLLIYNYDY